MMSKLVAPCGMNCSLCIAYLRDKNKCPGCYINDAYKTITRTGCRIRNCDKRGKSRFCFSCSVFPCERLKHLDKRYRTKYGMSMIDNLGSIKTQGIRAFIGKEEKKWIRGSKIFCVHNRKLYGRE
jgi:hypothetical protein